MTNTKKVLFVLGGLTLLIVGFALGSLGSKTSYGAVVGESLSVVGEIRNGYSNTLISKDGVLVGPITSSQAISLTGSVTLTSTLATYNPASFSSSTIASTTVAVTGAVLGDKVLTSFNSATSTEQWYTEGRVISAGNVVVNLLAVPGTTAWNSGLDISTSTLRVTVIH